jgi:hypothetical protein
MILLVSLLESVISWIEEEKAILSRGVETLSSSASASGSAAKIVFSLGMLFS